MSRHGLFEELDAIDSQWQTRFRRLAEAAAEYGIIDLYQDFLKTPEGHQYRKQVLAAREHDRENAVRRAQIEAEIGMAAGAGFQFGEPA